MNKKDNKKCLNPYSNGMKMFDVYIVQYVKERVFLYPLRLPMSSQMSIRNSQVRKIN